MSKRERERERESIICLNGYFRFQLGGEIEIDNESKKERNRGEYYVFR
jgi:hypothetical protein